jgi:hypothetical protein
MLQHNVASEGVGDNLFQVDEADLLLDGNELLCCLQWHDLAVVGIGSSNAIRALGRLGRKQPSQPTPRQSEEAS